MVETNLTSIHEDAGSIPGLTRSVGQRSGVAMNCGIGQRCSSDLVLVLLLWLWHRLAAVALIQPLIWELPYAPGCGPKKQKKRKVFERESNSSVSFSHLLDCSLTVMIFIFPQMSHFFLGCISRFSNNSLSYWMKIMMISR